MVSKMSTRWVVGFVALALTACSSSTTSEGADDGGTSDGSGSVNDASASTSDGSSTQADSATISTDGGAEASAGGRGIRVTVGGTTRTLDVTPKAARAGNGYSVQAAATENATLIGVTVLLVKANANGNAADYVEPAPGPFACSATVPAVPYSWARIQYTGPEGVYQYGTGATCVTLQSFGAVGAAVRGTFESSLDRVSGTGPATLVVTGSFDVDRVN